MSKKSSDWYVPPDWAFQFGWMVILPVTALLASMLLPILAQLKTANVLCLFWGGLGLGLGGIILLFFARLPLYRQRKFLTFGPKALPFFHRKLYWLAYLAAIAAVLLLGLVWLRVK
jgi:hypothetical protein